MPKRRAKTNKIALRDADICGVHLGGCMTPINVKKDRSLDHIIPQSFFKNTGIEADPREFSGDWNVQVMHKACNTKRAGFIHGLPEFQCPCHYHRVIGKDLYVCFDAGKVSERHLLLKNFVMLNGSENPTAVGLRVEPVSANPRTWPKGKLKIDPGNTAIHYLVCINSLMVRSFNAREIQRVKLLDRLGKRKPQSTEEMSVAVC